MQTEKILLMQGIWFHKQLFQTSCSMNGGVLAISCYKDLIFSGHSDGTIKVTTLFISLKFLNFKYRLLNMVLILANQTPGY